jgi:hypothetical protein
MKHVVYLHELFNETTWTDWPVAIVFGALASEPTKTAASEISTVSPSHLQVVDDGGGAVVPVEHL